MGITVALTGSSGNMGRETLPALLSLPFVDKIKLLYLNHKNERKFARKIKKKYGDRVEQIFGDIANYSDCESLVKDADYVVNLAAVIPPDSDHTPELTRACNVTGVQNLVKAVESMQKQPKFIHTSTVAVYGNRNYLHPWGKASIFVLTLSVFIGRLFGLPYFFLNFINIIRRSFLCDRSINKVECDDNFVFI